MVEIRHLATADHTEVVEIYNHYIEHTPITFDLVPYTLETRAPWFDQFRDGTAHVCLVAADGRRVCGYANSARFRPKAAYAPSVETSVYLHPDYTGRGLGSRLYAALFEYLATQSVHRAYAGITLPNAASMALHTRFGFEPCGVFDEVGHKFDQYWDVQWLQKQIDGASAP